jgi:hypothetical protein
MTQAFGLNASVPSPSLALAGTFAKIQIAIVGF